MGRTLRRTEAVALGDFALKSLGGAFARDSANLSRSLVQVVRYYLADRESGRDAWPYPGFLGDNRGGSTIDVKIDIDDAVWDAFLREAERQGASAGQLLQHAALYFVADRDSGLLARRIVDSLDETGS